MKKIVSSKWMIALTVTVLLASALVMASRARGFTVLFYEIDAYGETTTTDDTPVALGIWETQEGSSCIQRVMILARNPATGATKAWDATVVVKRVDSTVSVAATRDTGALVSAGDAVAMLGCTIGFYTDGVNAGVNVTGPAAATIDWAVRLKGQAITD